MDLFGFFSFYLLILIFYSTAWTKSLFAALSFTIWGRISFGSGNMWDLGSWAFLVTSNQVIFLFSFWLVPFARLALSLNDPWLLSVTHLKRQDESIHSFLIWSNTARCQRWDTMVNDRHGPCQKWSAHSRMGHSSRKEGLRVSEHCRQSSLCMGSQDPKDDQASQKCAKWS